MYFIDRNKIIAQLTYMDRLLELFNEQPDWTGLKDGLALERLAHNVIEAIIDVGNSMIDGFIMRDPGSYEDILDILLDERVIEESMHEPLVQVVQLRKMLVREFAAADHQLIKQVFGASSSALNKFSLCIKRYLENELGPVSAFMPEQDK